MTNVSERVRGRPACSRSIPPRSAAFSLSDRERAGREASPSGGILDSQSVKAPAPGAERAFDGAKKIVGRKRHIAVDTDGRLLAVNLTTVDVSDSAGAQMILTAIRKRWP